MGVEVEEEDGVKGGGVLVGAPTDAMGKARTKRTRRGSMRGE